MYDDDNEALAAEYVLGTLSADEREHAEGLLLIDPGFEAAVRQWERRLGELNVMVEAVEPPPDLWTKIKAEVLSSPHREAEEFGVPGEAELPRIEEAAPQVPELPFEPDSETTETAETAASTETAETSEMAEATEGIEPAQDAEPAEEASAEFSTEEPSEGVETASPSEELEPSEEPSEENARLAAFELSLLEPNDAAGAEPPAHVERGADVVYLAGRLRSLRRLTVALGAVAVLLAAYVAVWQIAPDLIPRRLRPSAAGLVARAPAPTAARPAPVPDRLVAVLQPAPTAPAFLLTIDRATRTLTVRNVSAQADAEHSYELWLLAPHSAKPRSLGLVGDGQYTQRPLPEGFDADALASATLEISYEPDGGSKTGAPSGPILFTGKVVEALPAALAPKT